MSYKMNFWQSFNCGTLLYRSIAADLTWGGAIWGQRLPIVKYGDFLPWARSSAETAEPIDLPFGLWWLEGSTSSIVFARWRQCAICGGHAVLLPPLVIISAHQHKAAGLKIKIRKSKVVTTAHYSVSVVEGDRISPLKSDGHTLEEECCFRGIFYDGSDAPGNLLCQLNGHVVPCASCLHGTWVENMSPSQFEILVNLVLCCLIGCSTWLSSYMLLMWDSAYVSGTVTFHVVGLPDPYRLPYESASFVWFSINHLGVRPVYHMILIANVICICRFVVDTGCPSLLWIKLLHTGDRHRKSVLMKASDVLFRVTSGYATMVHGRRCNPHRCTTTFASVHMEITSLWRNWWRHNSETIRDREKRRPPRRMKSSEVSNGENHIALRQLLQNRKLRHLCRHIWVQDGNCKKWLKRILVLVRSTIQPSQDNPIKTVGRDSFFEPQNP